ncbi:trypsin-like peptidase domain-containing protein [Streptomyces sp. NBC_00461]|uniref:trypsin-like peptidase domain-containing protein n=1 Tax=Streptomyces sp. NBC_00461 TaxID=2975750 RepID=UPI002E17DB3C
MSDGTKSFDDYPARCVVAVRCRASRQDPFVFRGTGCLIADGLVLTARHVMGDSQEAEVQFGLAPGSPTVSAQVCWRGQGTFTDIAVLRLADADREALPHAPDVRLARVHRDGGGAAMPCTALGFPRFARGQLRDPPLPYVDAFEVQAHVPLATSVRDGRLRLSVESTEGGHGSWQGMSGAPVFAFGFLTAVVVEAVTRSGRQELIAVPVALATGHEQPTVTHQGRPLGEPRSNSVALWQLLAGAGVVPSADDDSAGTLPIARRRSFYAATVEELTRRTGRLEDREHEWHDLADWARSSSRFALWTGPPWSGKTSLAAAFACGPPPDVDVVSYFCSRVRRMPRSELWSAVNDQLAALVGDPFALDPTMERFHSLWTRALDQSREQGRHLVLLIDGIDEMEDADALLASLPGGHQKGTHVLLFSRTPLESFPFAEPRDEGVDFAPPHLRAAQVVLSPTDHARTAEQQASHDMADILSQSDTTPAHVLLGQIAVLGPLDTDDLHTLSGFMDCDLTKREVTRVLTSPPIRRLVHASDRCGATVFAFAHDTLREAFLKDMDKKRRTVLDGAIETAVRTWADAWPDATPRWVTELYPDYLKLSGKLDTWGKLLESERWAALLHQRTGSHVRLLEDNERYLSALAASPHPPVLRMTSRALDLEELRRPVTGLPADLGRAWAEAGHLARAERIALHLEEPDHRVRLMTYLCLLTHQRAERAHARRLLDTAIEMLKNCREEDTTDLRALLAATAHRVLSAGAASSVLGALQDGSFAIPQMDPAPMPPEATWSKDLHTQFLFLAHGRADRPAWERRRRPGQDTARMELWQLTRAAAERGDVDALLGLIEALNLYSVLGVTNIGGQAQREALAEIALVFVHEHPEHPKVADVLEAAQRRCAESVHEHDPSYCWSDDQKAMDAFADLVSLMIRTNQFGSTARHTITQGNDDGFDHEASVLRRSAAALGAADAKETELARHFLGQVKHDVLSAHCQQRISEIWADDPDLWAEGVNLLASAHPDRLTTAHVVASALDTAFGSGMEDAGFELLQTYLAYCEGEERDLASHVETAIVAAVAGCVDAGLDESARLLADSLMLPESRVWAWSVYARHCAQARIVSGAIDGIDRAERICDWVVYPDGAGRILCHLASTALLLGDSVRYDKLISGAEALALRGHRETWRALLPSVIRTHHEAGKTDRARTLLDTYDAHVRCERDPRLQGEGLITCAQLHAELGNVQPARDLGLLEDGPVWAHVHDLSLVFRHLVETVAKVDADSAIVLVERVPPPPNPSGYGAAAWWRWEGEQQQTYDLLVTAAQAGLWTTAERAAQQLPTEMRARALGTLARLAATAAPERTPGLLGKGLACGITADLLLAATLISPESAQLCLATFVDHTDRLFRV